MNSTAVTVSKKIMKIHLIAFLCLLLFVVSNPGHAVEKTVLPEFTVEYELKKDETVVGVMTRTLTRLDKNRYRFTSDSKTTGFIALFYKKSIHERTEWSIQENRIISSEYEYVRNKGDKRRQVEVLFDRGSQQIRTSVNDSSWTMPMQEPIYDKLLYQVALMRDLSLQRDVSLYPVADGGRIKTYTFESAGRETIVTPVGEFNTIKLIRYKENNDDKAVLWCAPEMSFLPVRVDTIEEDGSVISARITSVSGFTTAGDASDSVR